jgi:hypothetical protein
MTTQKPILAAIRLCAFLSCLCALQAQQISSTLKSVDALPRLVRFAGTAKDAGGVPLTGVVGITFALYSEQTGGGALWMETQNVQADGNGRFTVLLGAGKPDGLPTDIFTSGQARWLGAQIAGQAEQSRTLLVSAPYALKAGDSETVGGLPASAFALANPAAVNETKSGSAVAAKAQNQMPAANPAVTGKGTIGYVPMWDTTSDIVDSVVFQKSSDVGIGTKTPAATLDVSGKSDIRDTLTLFPKGTDPTVAISGTAFKIDQAGKMTFIASQTFPGAGTVTSVGTGAGLTGGPITKTGTLSIASGGVTNAMLQHSSLTLKPGSGMAGGGSVAFGGTTTLGLKSCGANQVLEFVGGAWTCSSTGTGTITGVTAGTDLTGGGTGGTVTLNLDTTKVPQLATANTFTANQTVNGTLSGNSSSGVGVAGTSASGSGTTGTSSSAIGVLGSSSTNVGVYGTSNSYVGVFGQSTSNIAVYGASSSSQGVEGVSNTGYGVYGQSAGVGIYGASTSTFVNAGWGVEGVSSENVGVYGSTAGSSGEGASYGVNAGVWGDTGSNNTSGLTYSGVLGTADNNQGGGFYNNGISYAALAAINFYPSDNEAIVFSASGTGSGSGFCITEINGNLFCTGSKSAIVPVDQRSREVALYAVEAPENWFEDAGAAQLSNGKTVVNLEQVFGQTVNTEIEYHVFLTPKGDCKGLYVAQESATSFEVRELGGGTSNVGFDYRIMAKRKGYESVRLADKTKQFNRQEILRNTRPQVRPSGAPKAQPVEPVKQLQAATQPVAAQAR